mgnify:CR=1 FL=1
MRIMRGATLSGFLVVLISGCAGPTYVRFRANTEPPEAYIYEVGKPSRSTEWSRQLTEAEIKAGKVDLPEFVFDKPGYIPHVHQPAPLVLDAKALGILSGGGYYHNTEKVYLRKDPGFEGVDGADKIKLIVNSEPLGGRVYYDGKFVGTAPCSLRFGIRRQDYNRGGVQLGPLIVVHDACLPERQDLHLRVDPDWRYQSGETHEYATLFLLKRDPNYRPPVTVEGQDSSSHDVNITVARDKDLLDVLQQVGQIGVMIKSLQPIR